MKRFKVTVEMTIEAQTEDEAWAQVQAMGSQAMMQYSNLAYHRIVGRTEEVPK